MSAGRHAWAPPPRQDTPRHTHQDRGEDRGEDMGGDMGGDARRVCEASGHLLDAAELDAASPIHVRCVRGCGHAGWWLVPVLRCSAGGG